MEATECLMSRRSCRSFSPEMPPRKVIERVCEIGTYAPTGHGKQSPLIVAVTNRELRDRLSRMNAEVWHSLSPRRPAEGFDPFYGAPVVLLVLADPEITTHLEDGCSVITTLLNAAQACGLASCWVHRARQEFESPEGKEILRQLGIDERYVGIDHVALGFPAGPMPRTLPRKPDYVRWAE
ncbi:MAG: nitroreductase family protein [Bacteroidales bacterium]|nr:nitroreductase family protein [Bacteroidales bacterium]